MKNSVDFSYARPSGQELADKNLDALVYCGNAMPSQEYIDDLRSHGVVVTFIMETISTRSQQGFQAGAYDAGFAESRARQRGHTGSIDVVVSDGNSADIWDASEYGRGWASVATLPFFAYGATPICDSFNRGAGRSLGTHIPATWGMGSLMTQTVGASPVAGTDYNIVHADYTGQSGPVIPTGKAYDDEDTMLIINRSNNDMAIIFGQHRPRKIASINDYHNGAFVVLDNDAWQQYWNDAIAIYGTATKARTARVNA